MLEKLENLRLVFASNGLAIVPVYNLRMTLAKRQCCRKIALTYHRSDEVLLAFLELLERILLGVCAIDHLVDAAGSDIFRDCLNLVPCWGIRCEIELKLCSDRSGLGRLIACLVKSGAGGCVGGDLLEKVCDSHGCWRAGLVKDRHNIECLVLLIVQLSSQLTAGCKLTKRNILPV